MKKLILSALLIATFSTLMAQTFEVNGTVEGSNYIGQTAKLYDLNTRTTLDSAVVTKKGTFKFHGKAKEPILAFISVAGKDKSSSSLNVILEPNIIKADITNDVVSGGPLNNRLNTYYSSMKQYSYNKELEDIYEKYTKASDEASRQLIEHQYDSIDNLLRTVRKKESTLLFSDNKDNVVGAFALNQILQDESITLKEVYELINGASEEVTEYKPNVAIIERLKHLETTAPGQHYTDFECIDFETGERIHFSEKIEGRLVLADFWASWCRPCRHEISTNLIRLHEKYENEGLVILGVDVWDKAEKHREAVEQMGIKYPQVIDDTHNSTDLYGIEGIPHILLISPDGIIISRNLRGEQIEEAIRKALGK